MPLGQRVQFLARLEAHSFAGRDAYLGAGARVAADAGFTGSNAEHAKSAQLDAFAGCQGALEAFEDCIDGGLGLGAWKARAPDHLVYDVLFYQSGHLASQTVSDCTTLYPIDGTGFGSFVNNGVRLFPSL